MYFHRTAAALGTLVAAAWIMPAWAGDAPSDTVYLFSFFRGNGETGMYLAASEDGLHWTALNNNRPLLKPEVGEARLMRDPAICMGPDGRFHMVWTTSWRGVTIGYAHSEDLIRWSEQRAIPVFEGHPDMDPEEVRNCWAPEIYYHDEAAQFIVVWASTIEGRFPNTLGAGHGHGNHRQYYFTTADFEDISQARLMYDPGFQVIDAAIFKPDSDRYAMVVKNEMLEPEGKYLFLTFSDSPTGPWGEPTGPITGDYWCEGPAPLRIGDWWYIYFDKYRQGQFGAVRSMDLEEWEDVSEQIQMPEGARHGTAFEVDRAVLEHIKATTAP